MDAVDQALSKEDRLSDLPDSVLTNILSRLTTKEAVRTSLLARTWEMKWTCILNLDFNDAVVHSHRVTAMEKFPAFVQRVLHYCGNSKIQSFALVCSRKYDPCLVTQWILTALRQGIKRFLLDYPGEGVSFPRWFLGCETLEEVRIAIPSSLKVSAATSFRNLNILYIARVKFVNENYPYSTELFFIFPNLEIFSMHCCTWVNVKVIKIEAPRLLDFHVAWSKYGNGHDKLLHKGEIHVLGALGLNKFKWATHDFQEKFILSTPPTIAVLDHFLGINDFWTPGIGAVKFLKPFNSLIHLELSSDITEAMDRSGATLCLPVLYQVVFLKLESRYSGSTRALMSLLRKTPNLRCLEIHTSLTWKNDDFEMIGALPPCVMYRLESVYFTFRRGASIGFHLIRLLLQNAHVLERMQVYVPDLPRIAKTEIRMLLLLAPRASPFVFIEVE